MKATLLFVLALVTSLCQAQYVITIDAQVVDKETKQPLAYVNVGFINKSIGTVTNEDGLMSLVFDENQIEEEDSLQFSLVGYESARFTFKELVEKFQTDNKVALSKKMYDLEEVVVYSKWGKAIRLGSVKRTDELLAYWKDKDALGGEIAGFIKVPKGKHKLSEFSFNIVENISDSIKIRVNVYDYKNGKPKERFLSTPIYHTISSKKGIEKINLSPANIVVEGDIVISIELLEVYGEELGLAISQSLNMNRSFLRTVSQDKWTKEKSNGVDLSVLAKPILHTDQSSSEDKNDITTVSVLWDVSRSMKDTNRATEVQVLRDYLEEVKPISVEVVLFSNTIHKKQSFQYDPEGDELYNYLTNQSYLGSTDSEELSKVNYASDVTLLFSDGQFNLGNEEPIYTLGEFIVLSNSPKANHLVLNDWAQYNQGKYIPLYGKKLRKIGPRLLTTEDATTVSLSVASTQRENTIKGNVYVNGNPQEGVIVSLINSLTEVITDAQGNFAIKANIGDKLLVEYFNTLPKEYTIINSENLNIKLKSEFDQLSEVKLTGQGKIKKELTSKEEREQKKHRSGGAYYTLEKEDFPATLVTLTDIMRRFPAVSVTGTGRNAVFSTRGDAIGLFIIDNVPFRDFPGFLNVDSITSVSVIPGTIGAVTYGTLGKGGVIIITTRAFEKTSVNKVGSALIAGNDYTDTIQTLNPVEPLNSFEQNLNESITTNVEEFTLKGRVMINNKPVSGCYILQENTLNEAITTSNGTFSIKTKLGATLRLEYKDIKPKKMVVIDTSFLTIQLESLYEVLDEVQLEDNDKALSAKDLTSKEKRDAQKYRSGTGYQSIDKEDFNNGAVTYLVDLIRGRFPSIGITGEGDQARYFTRNPSSISLDPFIPFAVDGVILTDPPTFLNVKKIENITFKSSLASTNKYGGLGRNGVIEITTTQNKTLEKDDRDPLVSNNDYKSSVRDFSASYRKEIYGKATPENIQLLKRQFLNKIEEDPLDVNNYIAYYKVMQPLDNKEAIKALSSIIDLADGNLRVLRSLAFFFEEQSLFKDARKIHKQIVKLAPDEAQSHLDLAQSYKNEGQYHQSFEQLKGILVADSTQFNSSKEVLEVTEAEMKHLLTKYKDKVNYTEVPRFFYESAQIVDRRILIEWNDPQMEFDLQFVNPNKKYYNWSQNLLSLSSNSDAVSDGFLSKQFIIDDDLNKGEWLINITNNTSKKSKIPLFVKITVQSDYGSVNEQEQTIVIPVSQLDQKYTVNRIVI